MYAGADWFSGLFSYMMMGFGLVNVVGFSLYFQGRHVLEVVFLRMLRLV